MRKEHHLLTTWINKVKKQLTTVGITIGGLVLVFSLAVYRPMIPLLQVG